MDRYSKKDKDRRRGPDAIYKAVKSILYTSWLTLLSAFIFWGLAKPKLVTYVERRYGATIRTTWDLGLLRVAYYLVIALGVFALLGALFNLTRMKRKTDKFHYSFLFMFLLAVFAVFMYNIYFR